MKNIKDKRHFPVDLFEKIVFLFICSKMTLFGGHFEKIVFANNSKNIKIQGKGTFSEIDLKKLLFVHMT